MIYTTTVNMRAPYQNIRYFDPTRSISLLNISSRLILTDHSAVQNMTLVARMLNSIFAYCC